MAIKDVIKVSRKTFFNPRAWLGYDSLKDQTKTIGSLVKGAVAAPARPERVETFKEALSRLGLKESEARGIAARYFKYALFFLVLAILDFIWGFYLLFHHHAFLGLVLALTVCALLLTQAFRYHFWYFQIQHKKLGCSFEEWRASRVLSKETSAAEEEKE